MNKKLLLSCFLFCGMLVHSQITYEVGEGKAYAKITDAWVDIIASTDTEFIINVAAGTYVENELAGMADKKITIIGAGADKTIIMRTDNDFPFIEEYGENNAAGRVSPGYLFRSQLANGAHNFHLVCEKMTFKNIGTNRHNWGGALVVAEANNQAYEFRNCMFTHINARQGTLVGATPAGGTTTATEPIKVVFEDCFVDACYVHNFNNISALFNFKFGADLTIRNTTFMNTRVNLTNLNGADEFPRMGLLVSMIIPANTAANYASSLTIENVNVLNTDIIGGTITNLTSLIKMTAEADMALPPTCTITDFVAVNNYRTGGVDADLYFSAATLTPAITRSVFNAVKNTADDSAIETLEGATIGAALTYTSPQVNFEMDGDLPEIFVNDNGVKYLKRMATSVPQIDIENFIVSVSGKVLNISGVKSNDKITIYNLSGHVVKDMVSNSTSAQVQLTSGAYIVKVKNAAAKVII